MPGQSADAMREYQRAKRLRSQGQPYEAATLLKDALARFPSHPALEELLLQSYVDAGEPMQAIHESLTMAEHNPANLAALDTLCRIFFGGQDFLFSRGDADRVLGLPVLEARCALLQAAIRQQRGEYGRAMAKYLEVLRAREAAPYREMVEEAIGGLDALQMEQIIMFARQDMMFRLKLLHDRGAAIAERGYFLSESGMHMLGEVDFSQLSDQERAPGSPETYH